MVRFLKGGDQTAESGLDGPAERDGRAGKHFDAGGVLADVGEGEMVPRAGQPARCEQVLRVDVGGSDARRFDARRGQRAFEPGHRVLVRDHGGDGQAGHALVQHFAFHAVVEEGFGLVERLFAARGHLGDGVAVLEADLGDAVVPEFVLSVGQADPYFRFAPAVGKKAVQRLAHPVRAAGRIPVHAVRDADGTHGLKERRVARAALGKGNPAVSDLDAHDGPFLAEQGTAGRRRQAERGRRAGGVAGGGRPADMIQQFLCGGGLCCA